MRIVTIVAAGLLAVEFAAFGAAKLLAVASMRERAAHLGFSSAAYRGIGAVEIAGAAGVALGLVWPAVGAAAGIGLVGLMIGAVVSHIRNGDGLAQFAPAVGTGLVALGYLAGLAASA
ncbi:DoxX family protein [Nocardia otitidiscaviarum]|uniref:DoxX family protein n=1 Tax=Nocardia otitidiscaviarum TaxID=1823 RepID=UPI0004A7155E|nr:DoxX family protein [Nocardia otitidiscaviarum]MBF6136966.1 DoxX family protein [Nocardia otitidiscaviarum]MBF6485166.1 DoxX family protein [Nocardia otitidiscaviarum]